LKLSWARLEALIADLPEVPKTVPAEASIAGLTANLVMKMDARSVG
jgi:hypothetical protein